MRQKSKSYQRVIVIALSVGVAFVAAPVNAAIPEGQVHVGFTTSVEKNVVGQLVGQPDWKIIQSEKVFFDQNVITTSGSSIVIQFRDGSTFELGPNGEMVIDDLVFNPFEGRSEKALNLIRGSFRYVSGFISKKSEVNILTSSGTIGIRGSSMSGMSYPGLPVFVHVSKGNATFSNAAGQASFSEGQSMAVPDASTAPPPPSRVPNAVTAQALRHIRSRLGAATSRAKVLNEDQRKANAEANIRPVAQQQAARAASAPPTAAAVEATAATGTAAVSETAPNVVSDAVPDLPLLTRAAEVGLLTSAPVGQAPTPEQQQFLEQAAQAEPDAEAFISSVTNAEQQVNETNAETGTEDIIQGVSENSKTTNEIAALVKASVSANPGAARMISETAIRAANPQVINITDVSEQVLGAALSEVPAAAAEGIAETVVEAAVSVDPQAAEAIIGRVVGVAVAANPDAAQSITARMVETAVTGNPQAAEAISRMASETASAIVPAAAEQIAQAMAGAVAAGEALANVPALVPPLPNSVEPVVVTAEPGAARGTVDSGTVRKVVAEVKEAANSNDSTELARVLTGAVLENGGLARILSQIAAEETGGDIDSQLEQVIASLIGRDIDTSEIIRDLLFGAVKGVITSLSGDAEGTQETIESLLKTVVSRTIDSVQGNDELTARLVNSISKGAAEGAVSEFLSRESAEELLRATVSGATEGVLETTSGDVQLAITSVQAVTAGVVEGTASYLTSTSREVSMDMISVVTEAVIETVIEETGEISADNIDLVQAASDGAADGAVIAFSGDADAIQEAIEVISAAASESSGVEVAASPDEELLEDELLELEPASEPSLADSVSPS